MAFDFIPDHLDFDVAFEDTKMHDKKYVVNADSGQYMGIVGQGFQCASHGDFFRGVMDTATQELGVDAVDGAFRELNEVDKFFDADTGKTNAEIEDKKDAQFIEKWKKANEGKLRDMREIKDDAADEAASSKGQAGTETTVSTATPKLFS